MPVPVVTQLIVDSSGARQGVAEFEAVMAKAKAAAVTGGVATAQSFEAAQKKWVQSLGATDPVIRAQIRMKEDLAKQEAINTKAVQLGIATSDAAKAQLDAVRQKHEGMIQTIREQTGQLTTNEKAWSGLRNALSGTSGQLIALSSGAGPVGVFLSALGPWGIAAAVGIGAVTAVISHMADEAKRMGDGALALRNFAETTQLTITQIKALGRAGAELGVGTDTIAASVEKFTINMEEARKGQGALYDAVRMIDRGLADELASTTKTSQAWDVLAKARAAASDQSKNLLSKAAFGKGGIETGLVLDVTAEAGGLDAIISRQQKINGLSDDAIKKWATTKVQIDEAQKRTANLMAATYTQDVLDRMLQAALLEERMTRAIIAGTAERQKSVSGQYDPLGNFTPGSAAPLSPMDAARNNLAAGLSAGQKQDLSGYEAQRKAIAGVENAERSESDVRKASADAAIRDANKQRELIGYLGSAATAEERQTLRLKELEAAQLSNRVSLTEYNRAVAAVNLDTAIAKQGQYLSALGASAPIAEIVREKELLLQRQRQQDPRITQQVIEFQKQLVAAQQLGTFQIDAQTAAERVRVAALFMSNEAGIAYSIVQTKINEAKARGAPLSAKEITDLQDSADAFAKAKVQADRYEDSLRTVKDAGLEFSKTFVQGLMQGKTGMQALTAAADALASKMADKALTDLFSGNYLQAGVEAVVAIGASLFANNSKGQEKLKQAQAEWAKAGPAFQEFLKQMSGGVSGDLSRTIADAAAREADFEDKAWKARDTAAINAARAGLQKFSDTQKTLFAATFQATIDALNDGLGLDSPFMKAVNSVKTALNAQLAFIDDTDIAIGENIPGTMAKARAASQSYLLSLLDQAPALSAVQVGLMGIHGTASALQGALVQLGMSSTDAAAAINAGVSKAIASLKAQFEGGLTERLNTANGQGFLNDATKLIKQHQQDVLDAAALGTDPALVSATFKAEAQQIVNGADLVGDAFTSFTKQFPELAGVVVEATTDITASAKQLQDATNATGKTVVDYIRGLLSGTASTFSPTTTFANAQSAYNANLVLAQSGNLDAQNKFPELADNLEKAARAIYASSDAYQNIRNQIISQGLALPAVQQTTDPVVQVMRDVLTAINAGIQAQATDATLVGTIKAAIDAGNAAQVATALSTYFNRIDTNTSQSIDLTEMQSALGGMVNNAALVSMFTRLDADNSGSISRLDLIRAASQGANDNTAAVSNKIDTANSLQNSANSLANSALNLLEAQRQLLVAIQGLQSTSSANLALMQTALAPGAIQVSISGGPGQTVNNKMVEALNKIVVNTYMTALNTNLIPHQAGGGVGVLAGGGWITGGIPGRDSVLLGSRTAIGMPDEFVIRRDVAQANRSWLPDFNATGRLPFNDNARPVTAANVVSFRSSNNSDAALLAAINGLASRLERIERAVFAAGDQTASAITRKGDEQIEAVDKGSKRTAFAITQSAKDNKAA